MSVSKISSVRSVSHSLSMWMHHEHLKQCSWQWIKSSLNQYLSVDHWQTKWWWVEMLNASLCGVIWTKFWDLDVQEPFSFLILYFITLLTGWTVKHHSVCGTSLTPQHHCMCAVHWSSLFTVYTRPGRSFSCAVSCALSFRYGCDVTDSCQRWPGFTPWLSPPASADSSLGNHRPPGWRQPVRLRAGQPAQSIPLHFLSICSGLFINNYCLAELQYARWPGQGERLCDLSPPLGWLGSHTQAWGQT